MIKYLISISLLSLLGFCVHAQQGSDWAGDNVFICPSIGDTLGIKTDPCPECCYEWTPQEGLSCTDCKNPVVNIETPQTYSVKVTDPMLRWQETDEVDVAIGFGPISFTPTFLQQGRQDEKVTAILEENIHNVPIKWSFVGDSLGCTINPIDQFTAQITPGNKYGKITIKATDASNTTPPLCFVEKEIEINEGIKDLFAEDAQHPGRIAKNGETLNLVGHNDVRVTPIPNDEGFFPGQPDYRNDLFAGCPTPTDGNTSSFITSCSGDEEIIAGGLPTFEPKVFIRRYQESSEDLNFPNFGGLEAIEDALDGIEFKNGKIGSLEAAFNIGASKITKTLVEKYQSPDTAYKFEYIFGITGSLDGRIKDPRFSGEIDLIILPFTAQSCLFVGATSALGISGKLFVDPSTADSGLQIFPGFNVDLEVCLQGGYELMVDASLVEVEGLIRLTSCIKNTFTADLANKRLLYKLTLDPLVAPLNIKIKDKTDPTNDGQQLFDYARTVKLFDSITLSEGVLWAF